MTVDIPLGDSILVPVVLENPFTGARYPEKGEVLAVLDTGYTGFAVVPGSVYREIGLDLFEPLRSTARTADGRTVELMGAYALVRVQGLKLALEGLVETGPSIEELLLGVEWVRQLYAGIDGCSGRVLLDGCR